MNNSNHALLIVDYQYDFVNPNGLLYVKNSEKIQNYINEQIIYFKKHNQLVIASMDWHPINHCSFKIWPKHCIQNTKGAKLLLEISQIDKIIKKGKDINKESYSAFFDDDSLTNGLVEYLKENDITILTIMGIALDYCIKATVEDAIKLNYKIILDLKGCKAIKYPVVISGKIINLKNQNKLNIK